MGALHRAAALAGHAVAASRVGEPQVLQSAWEERKRVSEEEAQEWWSWRRSPTQVRPRCNDTDTDIPGTTTPTPGVPGSLLLATHLSALTPQAGAGEGMSGGDAPNA